MLGFQNLSKLSAWRAIVPFVFMLHHICALSRENQIRKWPPSRLFHSDRDSSLNTELDCEVFVRWEFHVKPA